MTSIHTNVGAISALQTLRSLATQMGETQRHVSSGLRVGVAADNAAYWSIATTMRSDKMAISAVRDALGLGAAKVDTAYAGTEAIVDALGSIKARIVAAHEAGVDRAKVQEEIEQLKEQAISIVSNSSFNGINFLQTNEVSNLSALPLLQSSVVASFVRSDSGSVGITRAVVDLKSTSMINVGGGGILQKDLISDVEVLAPVAVDGSFHEGHEDHYFGSPVTFSAGQSVTFDLALDYSPNGPGTDHAIVIDKSVVDIALGTSDGVIPNASALALVFQRALNNAGAAAKVTPSGPYYDIETLETSGVGGSSVVITNLSSSLAGGNVLGLNAIAAWDHDNMHPSAMFDFPGAFTLSAGSVVKFDVRVDGTWQSVVIDRALVETALGTPDGTVSSADDLASIIRQIPGLALSATVNGTQIVLTVDQTVHPGYGTEAAQLNMTDLIKVNGARIAFDLVDVDVTTDIFTVDEYLDGIEKMLQKATSSASLLGSLAARIDMQANFASRLSDSIDSGIGRLVDTDMNEASTRLKALQTQEQLAIQSLSIANASAEGILTLFR